MANFGTRLTNQSVAPHLVVSDKTQSMAVEFLVDPSLPALGQDPFLPNTDIITIPRGRLLGIVNPQTSDLPAYAQEGKSLLTLANGSVGRKRPSSSISSDIKPIGFAPTNFHRVYGEMVQPFPAPNKDMVLSLPYVGTSNGAYGAILPGDKVTAYYGSVLSETPVIQEVGKVVKWVEKTTYAQHQAASVTVPLTNAIYPAFVPRIWAASNAGTVVVPSSISYAWDGTNHNWVATINTAVTDVYYSFGQGADMIAGEMISYEAVGNAGGALDHLHEFPGFLKWVQQNYGAWQLPPLSLPRPYVTNTNEVPTSLGGNQWRLSDFPVVSTRDIQVKVIGTKTNIDGTTTSLDGSTALPYADGTWLQDGTFGQQYWINASTGVLQIDSSIAVTSLTVTYSSETGYLDGKLYDAGQLGLTDGRYSGVPGTPANLELFGVLAEMKVYIY